MTCNPELERRLTTMDADAAVNALLGGYGGEMLGYLLRVLDDPDDADHAFAIFRDDVRALLPIFGRACTFHAWACKLACRAARRRRQGEARRRWRLTGGGAWAVATR